MSVNNNTQHVVNSIHSYRDARSAIESLRKAIQYHNYRYYVEKSPIISDRDYDELCEELQQLERKFPRVHSSLARSGKPSQGMRAAHHHYVTVYTGPECGRTWQVEEFLANHGIPYSVVEVTGKSNMIETLCDCADGKRTAPIIAVGDEVIAGFEPRELERILARHFQR